MAKVKRRRKRGRMIAIVGIVLFMILYFAIPSLHNGLNHAFSTISKLDTPIVIEYLRSYGKLAAVVSFILMVLQSIAAPFPRSSLLFQMQRTLDGGKEPSYLGHLPWWGLHFAFI